MDISLTNVTMFYSGFNPLQNNTAISKMEYVFQVSDIARSCKLIFFLITNLGIGVVLRLICNALKIMFAYCPLMLLMSFFVGMLSNVIPEEQLYVSQLVKNTNANLFLITFLPVILFHTAFSMDYHGFGHSTTQVLIISILGFPLQAALLTVLCHGALAIPNKWNWEVTITFCIICCIIESDNVLQELNKTQARVKHVQLLLQGEQLATLAVAKFCYIITFEYYFGSHETSLFIFLTILWHGLACLFGLIFGTIIAYVFINISHDLVVDNTLTAFAAYFSFYICHIHLHQGGIVATIVTGVLLSPAKIKTTSDIEAHLNIFWDWLAYVTNTLAFTIPGVMVGQNPEYVTFYNCVYVLIVYIVACSCRCLVYIAARPLLIRVGHFLSWSDMCVVAIGPYRAAPTLIIAMLYREYSPEVGHQVLTYIVILCFLSAIINGFAVPGVLKLLGMYDLTHARAVNMKHAVAQVQECRNKAIHSLKMDRVVADANWLIVEESTLISKNSLRLSKMEGGVSRKETEIFEAHRAVCRDCGLENEVLPTQKEISDLEIEGKHRILKAKLVSLWRQYENGTLTKRSIRVMSTAIQNAMDKSNPWLDVGELEPNTQTLMKRIKAILEIILRSLPQKLDHGPPGRFRGALFRFFNMMIYTIFSTFLTLLDTYILMNLSFYTEWRSELSIPMHVLMGFDIFFFFYFFLEAIFLINALGTKEYFSKPYHKIDFICNVLIRTCLKLIELDVFIVQRDKFKYVHPGRITERYLEVVLLLRLNRLYIFGEVIIWKCLNLLEKYFDSNLVQVYDIGKAFLIANDRTLKYLRHIVQDKVVYTNLRRELEEDRRRVGKVIGSIQKERPNVAVTIKTQHAIKHVINEMADSIDVIYDEGLLDEIEQKYLKTALESTKKYLRSLEEVHRSSPQNVLMDVTWLDKDPYTANYLLAHSRLYSYTFEDVIIRAGDDPFGVFVLVSGLVKCIYKPSRETIENCRKHGAIPNCDLHISLKLEDPEEDYIGCGNVIGEMGAVTGRKFDMTIVCQSEVQVYYIPWANMWNAMFEMDNSEAVFCKIWKAIGIRIALLILQYIPNFQGWLREKTLLYLQRAFVPILSGVEELFLNDQISDVILIEGMVMDGNSRSIYCAPFYIPRTTNKLILPGTNKWSIEPKYDTRLLIIPSENAEESDIMNSCAVNYRGLKVEEQSVHDFLKRSYARNTLKDAKARKMRVDFHKLVMKQVLSQAEDSAESTETFSTDSDIPLMKIFQKHVKTAVNKKPDHRINSHNEFKIIDDVLEQSDEKSDEVTTDYTQYENLLRKKIKKKILKKKQNMQDIQTQTNINAVVPPLSENSVSSESSNS